MNKKKPFVDCSQFEIDYKVQLHDLYELMKFRVNDVLIVATMYDNFILEEDGTIAEELFEDYEELELRNPPPRITHVETAHEALSLLKEKKMDLVITMKRIGELDAFEFGKHAKAIQPDIPVVLLVTNMNDLNDINIDNNNNLQNIDYIFSWTGDSRLFLAIIKLVEDEKNVDADTKQGIVRVIIIVEDTVSYYSMFLPMIYGEVMKQTHALLTEGVNVAHKVLLRRARPKILLATNYEKALFYIKRYKDNVLGVISDVQFPKDGKKVANAGILLIQEVKKLLPDVPICLQSSDFSNKKKADELRVAFLHKNSPKQLHFLQNFMKESMGFGPFVFRLPDGKEIYRAHNLEEFEHALRIIPIDSIVYHGSRNHFSNWLYARGEYNLASIIKPLKVEDFETLEAIREFLLNCIQQLKQIKQKGIIQEFSPEYFDPNTQIVRIGNGSLGGKGRGLAFISYLIEKYKLRNKHKGIEILIPPTVAITTEYFDRFIEENSLYEVAMSDIDDSELERLFLAAKLPEGLLENLREYVHKVTEPIAVRSSSLMEDSKFQPYAGIYQTYMLPNNHPDADTRLKQLCTAIKLIYASTYSRKAKSFSQTIGQSLEIEKMAVLLQKLVGKKYQERFYPHISGVAQSINFYPVKQMKAKDGVATVALGLGIAIVDEGKGLTFCPKYPSVLPQLSSTQDALKNSQNEFYALKLNSSEIDLEKGETSTLVKLSLVDAKKDGTLKWVGSVYDFQNDRIIDSINRSGALLVTFAPVLKYNRVPLSKVLQELLSLGEKGFGSPVELEFAGLFADNNQEKHKLYVLQMRPLVWDEQKRNIEIDKYIQNALIYSTKSLGHGTWNHVKDMLIVKPEQFSPLHTREIKEEISMFNKEFQRNNQEYVLIGPGRWGTRDRFLGVPVSWNDINQARIIIEFGLENFQVDPSQGMHFFVNVTATKKGYLTIPYGDEENFIKWNVINKQQVVKDEKYVKHVRFPNLEIRLDGKSGRGVVVIPSDKTKS